MASGSAEKPAKESSDPSSRIQQLVTDAINEKLEQKAVRLERSGTAKAALKAGIVREIQSHVGGLDVWTRPAPGARKARFSREEITAAAIRIADAEGIEALSMRRIAQELGAGTMTIYHYVETKDELLTLVSDAVIGEVLIGEDEPELDTWRERVVRIATRTRDSLRRHPWVFDIIDDPPLGPKTVRHFDQSVGAVSTLPISFLDQLDIVHTVDEFVMGYCLLERNNVHTEGGPSNDDATVDYVESLVETGGYPHLAAMAAEHGLRTIWSEVDAHMRDDRRFDRNLNRLLDGIEVAFGLRDLDA
ncbi:MAG: TetR/AcrR family transcriptional regulator C-terminal domain-containing protein [Actinobacteria bacterium]|nr:TetR/AcrR family transcriptional regulator C-terminal domain-containing protein [Actinomycetota bacterium]MBS1900258.1 TetR/AcrR family transcriptional regulator C-terminal domain-containing protein [Actinomycetota bacterium]